MQASHPLQSAEAFLETWISRMCAGTSLNESIIKETKLQQYRMRTVTAMSSESDITTSITSILNTI